MIMEEHTNSIRLLLNFYFYIISFRSCFDTEHIFSPRNFFSLLFAQFFLQHSTEIKEQVTTALVHINSIICKCLYFIYVQIIFKSGERK